MDNSIFEASSKELDYAKRLLHQCVDIVWHFILKHIFWLLMIPLNL